MFPGGGGLFGMMNQMNAMMNQMINDPFIAGMPPPMVCRALAGQMRLSTLLPRAKQHSCSQMQQQFPQQQHAGPQVEEVHQHARQRAARGGGPIVEEPDEGGYCTAAVVVEWFRW